jgi:hypothetical protein
LRDAVDQLIEPGDVAEFIAFFAGPAGRAFFSPPTTMIGT